MSNEIELKTETSSHDENPGFLIIWAASIWANGLLPSSVTAFFDRRRVYLDWPCTRNLKRERPILFFPPPKKKKESFNLAFSNFAGLVLSLFLVDSCRLVWQLGRSFTSWPAGFFSIRTRRKNFPPNCIERSWVGEPTNRSPYFFSSSPSVSFWPPTSVHVRSFLPILIVNTSK